MCASGFMCETKDRGKSNVGEVSMHVCFSSDLESDDLKHES